MKVTTKDMVYIALFTSIMIVCAFITIPFAIPFTLQTFALFTIIGILGTKRAFISKVSGRHGELVFWRMWWHLP